MKKAFTLAEVLITLGIIGVVAAMTLPTLVQKNNEKVTITKLKKFMSVMNSAITMSINDNGPIDSWNLSTDAYNEDTGTSLTPESIEARNAFIKKYILPYVKYTKFCEYGSPNCYEYDRYSLDGTKFSYFTERLLLADGSVINGFWINNKDCNSKYGDTKMLNSICGEIFFDTNGRKGPNKTGEDVFMFNFTKYGVIPMGTAQQTAGNTFDDYCNKGKTDRINGYGCTAWVIYNENMDYLHCNDLSWDGKKKCK